MKEEFIQAGVTQFGSGWCWLAVEDGKSRTRHISSLGGIASHRRENSDALRRATSKLRASRSSGARALLIFASDERSVRIRSSTSLSASPAGIRIPYFVCGPPLARSD